MGWPMFFKAENDDSSIDSSVTYHTYSLDGADPIQLEKRLTRLERALSLRGGKVTSIKHRTRRDGRPLATVRYELPAWTQTQEPAA